MQRRGRWIVHEVGCQKISLMASFYYQKCLARLDGAGGHDKYDSWMSSICLAKAVAGGSDRLLPPRPQAIFDSSPDYLTFMDQLLEELLESGTMNGFSGLSVMADISARPKTLKVFHNAFALMERWPTWQSKLFQSIVISVVPIIDSRMKIQRGNAFSDHNFAGSIFAGVDWRSPYPELDLTVSFAHELGHQALMIYQQAGNLFKDDREWVYSGVRKTLRPVISSMHAAVALAYMIECARSVMQSENDPARASYLKSMIDEYQTALELGLSALQLPAKFEVCSLIFKDLMILVS